MKMSKQNGNFWNKKFTTDYSKTIAKERNKQRIDLELKLKKSWE